MTFYDEKVSKAKLSTWKSLRGFEENPDRFTRRLGIEKISEEDFLYILGIPPDKLFPPEYEARWLNEVLKSEEDPTRQSFSSETLDQYIDRGIIAPFLPLIRYYSNQLLDQARSVPSLIKYFEHPDQIIELFLRPYLQKFEYNIRRAVVLEVNALRLRGTLKGDNPSERFQDFVRKTRNQDYRLIFLKKYPVLTRYAQNDLELWSKASIEFLNYLVDDWQNIKNTFGIDSGDTLQTFEPSGDTHNLGRSVVIVVFKSGKKILFKPRNLEIDEIFQSFLAWCNSKNLKLKHKLMRIISYENHGWVEYMDNKSVENDEEFNSFYYRLGSLLAILHSLRTVDIHFENLVACGEYPIIVDLETLFHEDLSRKTITTASDLVNNVINQSIMSVGILPKPTLSAQGQKTFDVSAIGASVNQEAPYNVLGIDNFGRDDIKITNIPGWIPSVHNLPDETKNKSLPIDLILEGFSSTYDLLNENKDTLLSNEGPLVAFKKCKRRLIIRNTKRYGSLQMDAFHPDFLRDDLDRSWHWDNLWSDTIHRPEVENFMHSELKQIESNDIPHFTIEVDGKKIVGADGSIIDDIEIKTGWESAKSRIKNMSSEDKEKQLWFIRASTGEINDLKINVLTKGSKKNLLQGACEVGDEILKNLLWKNNTASFMKAVSIMGENNSLSKSFIIDNADHGLYEGTGGAALFLGYLGEITKKDIYKEAAQALINNIKKDYKKNKNINSISAFLGYGSLVYVFTHLATIWNDNNLLEDAEEFVKEIYPMVDSDKSLDLLTGASGCILGILPLAYLSRNSKAKKIAIKCGNFLLKKEKNGQSNWMSLEIKRGFSHGFSGVALALNKLGNFTKKKKYIKESIKILEHENNLLRENQWTDSHKLYGRDQVSWCHGAPGIALGRLGMFKMNQSADLYSDIKKALEEINKYYWMDSHCLCHGTLGNLEPFLMAKAYPGFSSYAESLDKNLDNILDHIIKEGWYSLLPNQTLSLGLMTGLSGLGYGLLRFYNDEEIPSVLILEEPSQKLISKQNLQKSLFEKLFYN